MKEQVREQVLDQLEEWAGRAAVERAHSEAAATENKCTWRLCISTQLTNMHNLSER